MRGRKQERAILMGWPDDDHEADLRRDDPPSHGTAGQGRHPDAGGQDRDPQQGSWDE